jgi:hypothetical protein
MVDQTSCKGVNSSCGNNPFGEGRVDRSAVRKSRLRSIGARIAFSALLSTASSFAMAQDFKKVWDSPRDGAVI